VPIIIKRLQGPSQARLSAFVVICLSSLKCYHLISFYRAMLGREAYCYGKSSVRQSVCNAEVSWSHDFENNFTIR